MEVMALIALLKWAEWNDCPEQWTLLSGCESAVVIEYQGADGMDVEW